MSRYATESSGGGFSPEFKIHRAVCCQLCDLGTHDKEWNGKVMGQCSEVNFGFEFVDIELEGDNETYHPIWGQRFTNSLGKKANLRKLLEGWRGKPFTDDELKSFDLQSVLGLPCSLVIQPNSNNKPKIMSIVKGDDSIQGNREPRSFWFEDFTGELPEWIPEWMQKIIQESYEWDNYHNNDNSGQDVVETPVVQDVVDEENLPF